MQLEESEKINVDNGVASISAYIIAWRCAGWRQQRRGAINRRRVRHRWRRGSMALASLA
jgi:hypothetical protein